jgi:hypothetical protein
MSPSTGSARLLEAAIIASGTLAVLSWLIHGLRLPLGFTTLTVSGPLRPAIVLAALAVLRTVHARRNPAATATPALPRLPLVVLTLSAIGYWLFHLTTISGGADSYGYVSAAALLRQGALLNPQPEAAWLPASNALAVLTPLGYVPRPGLASIVPLYPLGFPAVIAATSLFLPMDLAPYVVAPSMAALVLVLVHRLARQWTGDGTTAWLATCLAAWDPLVITYAKQPMSDIPAAAWLLLAVWCVVKPAPLPLLAGLAAGASFLTRPGGLGAVAAVALLAAIQLRPAVPALLRFAVALFPLVALQAAIQWHLFGSPWRTGYGALGELYSGTTLAENATIYGRALMTTHLVVWIPLVAVGLAALRRRGTGPWIVVLLAASLTPYLLYLEFDHWETLRFVLPAVVLLDIAAAAGAALVLQRIPYPWLRSLAVVAVAALALVHARTFLNAEGVPLLMEQERRYVLAAEWIDQHTPAGTLVFAGQHSGSLRHYAGRTTLRWDVMAPQDLAPVVREARRRGHAVYAALDPAETTPFRDRFAATTASVALLPGAQVRDVQIWELVPSEDR